jgi:hypothetical protein
MKDLGKAFSAYFKDPQWFSKALIAILWMLLSIVGIGIIVLAGYFVQVTQRVMRKEEIVLPSWSDLGSKIVAGFKLCVVYLVYMIPMLILFLPVIALAILSGAGDEADAMPILFSIYIFGITLLLIPYGLAISLFSPIIMYRFAEHERISDALDVTAIVREFRGNWQNALVVALIAMGIQSIAGMGIFLLGIGIFFTIFYSYVVSAYLCGVLYLSREMQEPVL